MSTSPAPPPASAPTDSGITHTIPNDSTVIVTKHTTITRGVPPSAATSTAATASTPTDPASTEATTPAATSPSPTPAQPTAADQKSGGGGGGISVGVVAGIAVGGVVVVALVLALLHMRRTRQRRRRREEENAARAAGAGGFAFVDKSGLHDHIFGDDGDGVGVGGGGRRRRESALLPTHPTPQEASTGGGYGYDPFAPFGGRADQPRRNLPPPPANNAFEMDGHGIQVIELPGTAITTADNFGHQDHHQPVGGMVEQRPSSDPRATLNHLPRDNGRPTYINQWNQYKTTLA